MTLRIAVYGGSFDPFTNGHLAVVQFLADSGEFDGIELVPAASHALKPELTAFEHRLAMASLGTADRALPLPVTISSIEGPLLRQFGPPVRTWELLQATKLLYPPETSLRFVIGPDLRKEFPRWQRVEDIEKTFGFFDVPAVSSIRATAVRRMMREGNDTWKQSLPPSVVAYIEKNPDLYRGPLARVE